MSTEQEKRDAAGRALEVGQPVRVRRDPWGIAWVWGAVHHLRGNVVEIAPDLRFVRVRVRIPRAAAGRMVNVSPLLLLPLPSKRGRK